MRRGMWIGGVLLCLLLPACSSRKPPTPTPNFVTWSQQAPAHTKQLCVLPFENTSQIDGLAEKVRQGVAGHLSIKRFTDAELHEIDTTLAGLAGGTPWHHTNWAGSSNATPWSMAGSRSRTGSTWWFIPNWRWKARSKLSNRPPGARSFTRPIPHVCTTRGYRSPRSVWPASAARTLRTFTDAQLVRAIDDLSRNLAALVPDLPATDRAGKRKAAKRIPQTARFCLPGSSGGLSLAWTRRNRRPGSCAGKAMRRPLPRWQG